MDTANALFSALNHVALSIDKVDDLVPFLADTGCGRSSLTKRARDQEDQDFQICDSDCADGDPHSVYEGARKHARMKWKQVFTLSEIGAIAAELQSLQKCLLAIKSEIGYVPGEKEMVNTLLATKGNERYVPGGPGGKKMVITLLATKANERSVPGEKEIVDTHLDDQLRMVVCSCEEFCARADKFMGYTSGRFGMGWKSISAMEWLHKRAGTRRARPRSSDFTPMCRLRDSAISQRMTAKPEKELAIEKQSNTMDRPNQSLVQLALSIRNRGRAALPDEDLPHQVCDLSDVLCFMFSTLVCPSLTWLSFRSLGLESASALDQSVLTHIPSVAIWITTLGNHHSICMTIVASSIIISTGATALPVWKACMRGRSSAYVSSWLLVALSAVLWSTIGGSVATLFLELIPFASGFGAALGLLWHKQMSNAQ